MLRIIAGQSDCPPTRRFSGQDVNWPVVKVSHLGNRTLPNLHVAAGLLSQLLLSALFAQQLAVLDIAPIEISEEDALTLSKHFREVISVKIGEASMPPESIRKVLSGDKVNNRWCAEEWCGKEVGELLSAEKVVVSSVWKDEEIYRINGLLIDTAKDTVAQTHKFDFAGEEASLFTEVEVMAYQLFGKPMPPDLSRQHQYITERSLALQGITERRTRLTATLLSTAVPGLGQFYLKRIIWGGTWLGTELALGSTALSHYIDWRDAYGDFFEFEEMYLASTDVVEIEDYRNEMLRTYDVAENAINQRKKTTRIIASLWVLNILHAYLISPSTEEILEEIEVRYAPEPSGEGSN